MNKQSQGFTLIEVVIALFFIFVGVIATAPMFVMAAQEVAGGGDMGTVGAAAVRQMELLRGTDYINLTPGGSLTSDVTGYTDSSNPEFVVRWTIAVNANPPAPSKIITVQATAVGKSIGSRKNVTLLTVRGG
jgi:competence protein ComGC